MNRREFLRRTAAASLGISSAGTIILPPANALCLYKPLPSIVRTRQWRICDAGNRAGLTAANALEFANAVCH